MTKPNIPSRICKYASMKVCKYARGHLVWEQIGRLIGKGPHPIEKFMKALGEVSLHCESFYLKFIVDINFIFLLQFHFQHQLNFQL